MDFKALPRRRLLGVLEFITPTWRHAAAENVDGNSQHAYPSSRTPPEYSSRPSSVSSPSNVRIIRLALGEVRVGLATVEHVPMPPHPARIPNNSKKQSWCRVKLPLDRCRDPVIFAVVVKRSHPCRLRTEHRAVGHEAPGARMPYLFRASVPSTITLQNLHELQWSQRSRGQLTADTAVSMITPVLCSLSLRQ